jgi:hypothetical protein
MPGGTQAGLRLAALRAINPAATVAPSAPAAEVNAAPLSAAMTATAPPMGSAGRIVSQGIAVPPIASPTTAGLVAVLKVVPRVGAPMQQDAPMVAVLQGAVPMARASKDAELTGAELPAADLKLADSKVGARRQDASRPSP